MPKTIWKFQLQPQPGTPIAKVQMPQDAVILTAAAQGDSICVWAETNQLNQGNAKDVFFEVYGTGHDMICDEQVGRRYIGTAFLYGGSLVFHVYHVTNS